MTDRERERVTVLEVVDYAGCIHAVVAAQIASVRQPSEFAHDNGWIVLNSGHVINLGPGDGAQRAFKAMLWAHWTPTENK